MTNKLARSLKIIMVFALIGMVLFLEVSWNFNTYISPYLSQGSVSELYHMYQSVCEVEEETLLVNQPTEEDNNSLLSKLMEQNINLLEESIINNPVNLSSLKLLATNNFILSEKEVVSLLNNLLLNKDALLEMFHIEDKSILNIVNLINQFDVEIINLNIITSEEQLQENESLRVKFTIKLNLENLGFFVNLLLPKNIYLTLDTGYIFSTFYEVVNARILVNNQDEQTSAKILNFIAGFITKNKTFDVNALQFEIGNQVMDLLNLLKEYLNIHISFNNSEVNVAVFNKTFSEFIFMKYLNLFISNASLQKALSFDIGFLTQINPVVVDVQFIGGTTKQIKLEIDTDLTKLKENMSAVNRALVPNSPNFIITIDFMVLNRVVVISQLEFKIKNVLDAISQPILNAVFNALNFEYSVQELEALVASYINEYVPMVNAILNREIIINENYLLFAI